MSAEENARHFYFDPERVQRRLDGLARADVRIMAKNRSTVVRLGYPRFLNRDLAKWLHRIDVPTLLLWGENDGLVPPKFGRAYRELIPNSELVVIPRAGHAPFEEQPDAFLDAFAAFQISCASSLR
jgi:pimeloyl-ACP methyl ester carboxylesterase